MKNSKKMTLTGKALENFKNWYMNENQYNNYSLAYPAYKEDLDLGLSFWNIPESMQWGVLVDFFDSKDIIVEQNRNWDMATECYGDEYEWDVSHANKMFEIENGYNKTLNQSRKSAIKKANEIYNSIMESSTTEG